MASSSSTSLNFTNFFLVEYLKPKPKLAIEELAQQFSSLQIPSNSRDWPEWPPDSPEPIPSPPSTLPFFTASALAIKIFHYYNHPLNSNSNYISRHLFPQPWNPSHVYRFGQGIGHQIEIVMPPNYNAISASPMESGDSDSSDPSFVPSDSEHSFDSPSVLLHCIVVSALNLHVLDE